MDALSKQLLGSSIHSGAVPSMQLLEGQGRAPSLTGRHTPSKASLQTLYAIDTSGLQLDKRHGGRVIYLAIQSISILNGMNLAVRDSSGKSLSVLSLIEYPVPGGKAAMPPATIIAIKEPYYGRDANGRLSVCVHHPTDFVRISQYDQLLTQHCPPFVGADHDDFTKAGDTAFTLGQYMDAVDVYAEGIKRIHLQGVSDSDTTSTLLSLHKKRAFAYTRLELHDKAIPDELNCLKSDLENCQILKLTYNSMMNAGFYDRALSLANSLISLNPDNISYRHYALKAAERLKQVAGNYNFARIAKSLENGNNEMGAPIFYSNIEIRKSRLHGHGVFAKSKVNRGELLVCERPIAFCSDGFKSSFKDGVKGLMAGQSDWVARANMSFLQAIAETAISDPKWIRLLFGLFAGSNNAPRTPDMEEFDR